MEGVVLANETGCKHLGVYFKSNLKWRNPIDSKIKKANSVLGFIKRNLIKTNKKTKTIAYQALVRPHLEYSRNI